MVKGKAKLIFGTGDIMMTPVLHSENDIPRYGMLAFKTTEPHEIGSYTGNDTGYRLSNADALMVFYKVESIDACIERLNALKEMMLGGTDDVMELDSVETEDDFII